MDTHFGTKINSQAFLKYQLDYFEEKVFPEFKKQNLKHVVQFGDFFNDRKALNVNTHHWVKTRFLDPIKKMGIKLYIIIGNHDVYYTRSNEITSLSMLKEYGNITLIYEPSIFNFYGLKVSMIPWLSNEDDIEKFKKFIKENPHDIMFGHFELGNFEVIPGHVHEGGLDKDILKNFEAVYSGHFHQKQSQDNIHYLGTPYELTWSDYKGEKGWHTIDTQTKELEFFKNDRPIHCKIYYDEDFFDDCRKDLKNIQGKIVKLFTANKTNEAKFSNFIFEMEQGMPESFVIIDHIEKNDDVIVSDDGKCLLDVIKDYLKDTEEKDIRVEKILSKLYREVVIE